MGGVSRAPGPGQSWGCRGETYVQRVPMGLQERPEATSRWPERGQGWMGTLGQGPRRLPGSHWGGWFMYRIPSPACGSVLNVPNPELRPGGPGNRAGRPSQGGTPQNDAGPVLVRGLRGLAGTCRIGPERAFLLPVTEGQSQASPQPAARRPGPGQVPGVWVAAGGSAGQTSCVLAAPACPRPGDVHSMAGGGQAHPAVCQPQGRPPEGGHSVRSLLLTHGLRPGPLPGQARLACPQSLGDVGCHGPRAGQGRGTVCLGICHPTRPAGCACRLSA